MAGHELGLGGQPCAIGVSAGGDLGAKLFAQKLIYGFGSRLCSQRQIPPRATNCAAMTLRWISLVPSPTIISGASRK